MTTKLNCVIVDDEPVAIEILKEYVEKVSFLRLKKTFRNSVIALEYLGIESIDLLFLDINMPDLTGIQFLNTLTKHPMVIFTTAYSEYAVESYEYKALDYLLKPIEFDRFMKAVNKAKEHFELINNKKREEAVGNKGKDFVLIKSGTEFHRTKINDVLFVRGAGNYVVFVTPEKNIMSLLTMKEVLDLLPQNQFIRIHKSYIVNLNQVEIIETDKVIINKNEIYIGDAYKHDFMSAIKNK
ncbi:LytR/AlgR family response regulator transcription factor [Bacteroidota bacterium]